MTTMDNGPDFLEQFSLGWPKFETTISCDTCRETWKAVQTSPTKEALKSWYMTNYASGDALGHGVKIVVQKVSRVVQSEVPHRVPYEPKFTLIDRVETPLKSVGYQIAMFLILQVSFSFIWAILGYELFPNLAVFQLTAFPSGVFDPNTLTFMTQLIFWFPFFMEWSFALWLWNGAQRKVGPEDLA